MTHTQAKWPTHAEDELQAVQAVLASGNTNYWTGTEGRRFEEEFAAYTGAKHAIALMNGTVALEAALFALDIGPGDEVITTCRTFIASASCIVMRGATPVLADVDPDSQNVTVATLKPHLTARTKALIIVHLAGWPADMPEIMAFAREHQLKVIEDCAQAHGAAINGQRVGSWGDIGAFSFCQDKIMTTGGEGGIVTTDDSQLWEKIWGYKDHGKNYQKVYHAQHPPGFRWLHDSFGTNWRMTEVQAALGRVQLQKLPSWLKQRQQNAAFLTQSLKAQPALRIPQAPAKYDHAYYKYYVFVRPERLKSGWNRDRIMQAILDQNLPCFSGSCSEIYLEGAFVNSDIPTQTLATAKTLGQRALMFLIHPNLARCDLERLAQVLNQVMTSATLMEATVE